MFRSRRKAQKTVYDKAGAFIDGRLIINSVEQSTMASNWTEQLCLSRLSDDKWRIDVCGFEWAEETGNFWDEEADEYVLPDEIDGYSVLGTEDDYVVIAKLVSSANVKDVYEFDRFDRALFIETFSQDALYFCDEGTLKKIEGALAGGFDAARNGIKATS